MALISAIKTLGIQPFLPAIKFILASGYHLRSFSFKSYKGILEEDQPIWRWKLNKNWNRKSQRQEEIFKKQRNKEAEIVQRARPQCPAQFTLSQTVFLFPCLLFASSCLLPMPPRPRGVKPSMDTIPETGQSQGKVLGSKLGCVGSKVLSSQKEKEPEDKHNPFLKECQRWKVGRPKLLIESKEESTEPGAGSTKESRMSRGR